MIHINQNKEHRGYMKDCEITIVEIVDNKFEFNILDKMKNEAGVWVLYGKSETSKGLKWQCLQVGQSSNIVNEIKTDLYYLFKSDEINVQKTYVNQYGESVFKYIEYPSVREQLYSHINQNFKHLKFILISKEIDMSKRKNIEKYFAWSAHSLFWRNGGAFTRSKEIDEEKYCKLKSNVLKTIEIDFEIKKTIEKIIKSYNN